MKKLPGRPPLRLLSAIVPHSMRASRGGGRRPRQTLLSTSAAPKRQDALKQNITQGGSESENDLQELNCRDIDVRTSMEGDELALLNPLLATCT